MDDHATQPSPSAAAGPGQAGVPAPQGNAVTPEAPGRYSITAVHGRGGQSRVLLAVDSHIGREIALKELLLEGEGGAGATPGSSLASARFLREARITGQLEHPNIVPVYEVGQHPDGRHYYTQRLVRGLTFEAALARCRSLDDRLGLLRHFVDICDAMAYAHSRGVLHRDLKPGNVMVGQFGETVVLDWGLAKARDQPDLRDPAVVPGPAAGEPAEADTLPSRAPASHALPRDPNATLPGAALGTPGYMSPEQARGRIEEIDERSDVWSLGAILYELLAGRPPFQGARVLEVLWKVSRGDYQPIGSVCPEAPAELCAVAERALSLDKARRYANAKELGDEISAYQAGGRVRAYEYSSWELAEKFVRRNRVLSALAATGLLALVILAAGVTQRYRETRRRLAETLVTNAHAAERELGWARAAAFYAAARVQEDRPDARWGLVLASERAALPLFRLDHPQEAPSVGFSPDAALVAVPNGHEVWLWDARKGTVLSRLRGHQGKVWRAVFSPDGAELASAAEDGTVRLWSVALRAQTASLPQPETDVRDVQYSPDGKRLGVADQERNLRLLEGPEHTARLLSAKVWGFAFSPDGATLAAGTLDGPIALFDPASGRVRARLYGHRGAAQSFAFSPGGKLLASASVDGTVRLWDLASGATVSRLEGFNTPNSPAHLAFLPDGRTLALTSHGNSALLFDVEGGREIGRLEGHRNYVLGLAVGSDGRVATASRDGSVQLWDVAFAIDRKNRFEAGEGLDCAQAIFTPDGAQILAACASKAVQVWDRASGRAEFRLAQPQPPASIALSSHGVLASGGFDGSVRVRDPRGERVLGLHRAAVRSVAFVASGSTLLSAGKDGEIILWDFEHGTRRGSFEAGARLNSAAISPDGTLLAVGGDDGTLGLRELPSGRERARLPGHERRITAVAFSPDGKLLASCSSDATARLWRADSGEPVARLDAGAGLVHLAFSPDGALLATAGESVRLWSVASREQLVRRDGLAAASVTFTPDGSGLLVGKFGGSYRLLRWDGLAGLASPEQAEADVLERYRLELRGGQVLAR